MAGFLNWLSGFKGPKDNRDFQDDTFKVGQIWKYKTRSGEEHSTLTILKVEKYDKAGVVIHIYVNGLKIKSPQRPTDNINEIGHLPLSKDAMIESVTSLVSSANRLPDFREGYNNWKEAFDNNKGGFFTIVVSDAVKYVEEAMNSGNRKDD